MDGSPASLEGEVCYIEVSVIRKGMTQQAAQGCSRQQQPMRSLDCVTPQQIFNIYIYLVHEHSDKQGLLIVWPA